MDKFFNFRIRYMGHLGGGAWSKSIINNYFDQLKLSKFFFDFQKDGYFKRIEKINNKAVKVVYKEVDPKTG
jgi:hypothetical protein